MSSSTTSRATESKSCPLCFGAVFDSSVVATSRSSPHLEQRQDRNHGYPDVMESQYGRTGRTRDTSRKLTLGTFGTFGTFQFSFNLHAELSLEGTLGAVCGFTPPCCSCEIPFLELKTREIFQITDKIGMVSQLLNKGLEGCLNTAHHCICQLRGCFL